MLFTVSPHEVEFIKDELCEKLSKLVDIPIEGIALLLNPEKDHMNCRFIVSGVDEDTKENVENPELPQKLRDLVTADDELILPLQTSKTIEKQKCFFFSNFLQDDYNFEA